MLKHRLHFQKFAGRLFHKLIIDVRKCSIKEVVLPRGVLNLLEDL